MGSVKRRYSKEEFARRGDALYKEEIRPHLMPSDTGKFLALDIETGAYEIAKSELKACDRLSARLPDAQIWMVRIGYSTVYGFGGQPRREAP